MPKAKTAAVVKKSAPPKPEKVTKTTTTKKAAKAKPVDQADLLVGAPPSEAKQEIIAQFQIKDGDTGSPEVQVALLSSRIEKLVGHLKTNPSDNHSRRGLLGIVSKRRRLLNYLEKKDEKRYKMIAQKLGLGK